MYVDAHPSGRQGLVALGAGTRGRGGGVARSHRSERCRDGCYVPHGAASVRLCILSERGMARCGGVRCRFFAGSVYWAARRVHGSSGRGCVSPSIKLRLCVYKLGM